MARSIHWKATVAVNILLSLSTIGAFAQSPSVKTNITYSCRAERLGSVIEYLSKNSGYDFIYSRDLIDISIPVSLSVKNKPIIEVLALIETQVNVSFKLKDHHIIVKNIPKTPSAPRQVSSQPALQSGDSLLITSISKSIPMAPVESHAKLLQSHLDKRIREVQRLLGTDVPRNIPLYFINHINFNNRYRGWFISIGTHVGENSSGLELQAGLPYLYAVFDPHWALGRDFYGSYGVGNSFHLTGNFSFNTVYLYSGSTTSEITYPFSNPMIGSGPAVCTTQAVRHHQVRMMVQYSFSKNLSVRAGPVLNYRSTFNEVSISTTTATPEAYPAYGNNSYSVTNQFTVASRSRLLGSWVGWDASIQYRINFFDRK